MERATLDDLIRRKIQRDNDKTQVTTIDVPSIGKSLVFERISDADIVELMNSVAADSPVSSAYEMYRQLIYRSCPLLHDKTVRDSLGAVEPPDTVNAIFSIAEIMDIGGKLSVFCGFDAAEENVKNA